MNRSFKFRLTALFCLAMLFAKSSLGAVYTLATVNTAYIHMAGTIWTDGSAGENMSSYPGFLGWNISVTSTFNGLTTETFTSANSTFTNMSAGLDIDQDFIRMNSTPTLQFDQKHLILRNSSGAQIMWTSPTQITDPGAEGLQPAFVQFYIGNAGISGPVLQGGVLASAVPVPASAWLFACGLSILFLLRRGRRAAGNVSGAALAG